MIHKSSIMVDDYLDEDDTRNGAQSFHHQYPNRESLILLENSMQAIAQMNFMKILETVSFFKESIGLGYSCFHKSQSTLEYQNLEKLGEAFGYFYQCINDLEAFGQKERYERYKGKLSNFGKKNIAMLTLYNHLSEDEKSNFTNYEYEKIVKLYREYNIEQEVLEDMKKTFAEIKRILKLLNKGNRHWVKEFRILFNYFLADKRWINIFEL